MSLHNTFSKEKHSSEKPRKWKLKRQAAKSLDDVKRWTGLIRQTLLLEAEDRVSRMRIGLPR